MYGTVVEMIIAPPSDQLARGARVEVP
jgi:hypothetical protein